MKVDTPKGMNIFLIISLPGTILFLCQMIYECIYLTYKNGPQMIGFSLIHNHVKLYIFMVFSFLASIIWTILYLVWLTKVLLKNNRPQRLWIFILTVFVLTLILLLEPISTLLY